MPQPVTFVHITDLHVGNPDVADDHLYSDTTTTLRAILAEVKQVQPKPSFILATGDLTNRGDPGSFMQLKALMDEAALDVPVLYTLGNHDTRQGFYSVMLERSEDIDRPYDHSTVIDGVHVVAIDTSTPFKVGGHFEAGQAEWLEAELDRHPDLPKLLAMHHPPALDESHPELEWESLSFADTARLAALLAGRNVLGIMCGHMHIDRVSSWHGIPVVVGIGQHAATDVLFLQQGGFRMLSGASFAIGTVRPSGLTVTFAPQPAERRELKSYGTLTEMAGLIRQYEATAAINGAAAE
jgi:3',5'-cyclic AMP phosphodiesterase CpdA